MSTESVGSKCSVFLYKVCLLLDCRISIFQLHLFIENFYLVWNQFNNVHILLTIFHYISLLIKYIMHVFYVLDAFLDSVVLILDKAKTKPCPYGLYILE